uniref:Putative secreted protein n=1 Tax=Ixodes ricinus TaxID=34613 RepID=A0A6B0UM66_IXORI
MTTAWFGARRSIHIRMLPSCFLTTTMGDTHSDASTRSMTPSRSNLKISSETWSLRVIGSRRSLACTGDTLCLNFTLWVWFLTRPSPGLNRCSKSSKPGGNLDVSLICILVWMLPCVS